MCFSENLCCAVGRTARVNKVWSWAPEKLKNSVENTTGWGFINFLRAKITLCHQRCPLKLDGFILKLAEDGFMSTEVWKFWWVLIWSSCLWRTLWYHLFSSNKNVLRIPIFLVEVTSINYNLKSKSRGEKNIHWVISILLVKFPKQ